MQFPPLIAVIARLGRAVFDDSVLAARIPAALGGAATLAVMLWLCRRLGGGAWAMVVLTLASLAGPVFVRTSVLMQPVVFDQLWATLAIAAVMLAAQDRQPRWWLLAGLALGLGALTKFSAAFYAVCIGMATLLVPTLRGQLLTRWPWFASLTAAGFSVPSVTGQIAHDWPFLAQMQSLRAGQLAEVSASEFLLEQPLLLGAGALVAAAGVIAAIRGDRVAQVAALVVAFLIALLLIMHGKSYYAAPAYPALMVAGAAWLSTRVPPKRTGFAVRFALPAALTAGALVLLPLGVPMLSPDSMVRYAARLGAAPATETNRGEQLMLPQDYADMLGWRALADSVARAVGTLTVSERNALVISASNYGRAGALAMYHRRLGLPYPASPHGDFHAWGIDTAAGSATVFVHVDDADALEGLRTIFSEVTQVARIIQPRAVPEEQDVRIYQMRGPKQPLTALWRSLGPRWN
jgi:hypothetical protein